MASDEERARYSTTEDLDTDADELLEQGEGHKDIREHVDSVEKLPAPLKDHILLLQTEVARLTRANRGLQMQRVRAHPYYCAA